jgi:cell division protein FtsB
VRALLAILLLVLLALQFKLWFGEGGYRNVQRLAQRVEEQAQENELLAQRNRELQAEVEDLRQGLEAIEERARNELGLIKENEEFYQVVPAPESVPEQGEEQEQ